MKNLLFFFSIVCCTISSASAQSIRDTAFRNVIRIERENIATAGKNYLVDIPVKMSKDVTIFLNEAQIPISRLLYDPGFYPELMEFILISPDWDYYHEVAMSVRKAGITCAEPVTTIKYYKVKRSEGRIYLDSIVIKGNQQPELSFREKEPVPAGNILVYDEESFGSVCCPRDSKWDLKPTLNDFISTFQKKHHVAVSKTYSIFNGKEGEHTLYYTLPELSKEQKLTFILEKSFSLIPNAHVKETGFTPRIFTPKLISTEGMRYTVN